MNELVSLLIEKNFSISSVESFTCGYFASELGKVPNVSKVYKGSIITYQNEIKEKLLGIDKDVIERYGVVSKEVASLMCINAKQIVGTDICVSFTGNAGPTSMEEKPVGLVFIGVASKDDVLVYRLQLEGSRESIKKQAVEFVTNKLINYLKEK